MTQKSNVIDTKNASVERQRSGREDDFVNNNDNSNKFLYRQVIFVFHSVCSHIFKKHIWLFVLKHSKLIRLYILRSKNLRDYTPPAYSLFTRVIRSVIVYYFRVLML